MLDNSFFERVLKLKNLTRLIGIALFCYILSKTQFMQLWNVLTGVSIPYLVTGFFLTFPIILLRSVRWNLIMRSGRVVLEFSRTFYLYLIGTVSYVTPGRIGEFIKSLYIKENHDLLPVAVPSIIIDRFMDLLIILVISFIAIQKLLPNPSKMTLFISSVLLLLVSSSVFLAFFQSRRIRQVLLRIIRIFVPTKLENIFEKFKNAGGYLNFDQPFILLVLTGCLSAIAFSLQVLRIQTLGWALGIQTQFTWLMGVVAIMALANLLPITISGIGTRDAVFLFFYSRIGVTKSETVALSLIILFSLMIYSFIGIILIFTNPPEVQWDDFELLGLNK